MPHRIPGRHKSRIRRPLFRSIVVAALGATMFRGIGIMVIGSRLLACRIGAIESEEETEVRKVGWRAAINEQ